jgi:hypothetical protein
VLPLPKGEGWGEGEGIVRQPIIHLIQPTLHERVMQFGGRGLAISHRGLAVSNLQIGYLADAHRLLGTYRISTQLQSTPANPTKHHGQSESKSGFAESIRSHL